jgi:phosphatidate cytidylyltransferase
MFLAKLKGRGGGFLDRGFVVGLLYCGLPAVALVWMRSLPWGFYATLFVMMVVWGADIAAYFTGRALGGPKLAPAISPNKTWSGAAGGLVGSLLAAAAMALLWPGHGNVAGITRLAVLALPLAVASILGDLYESWLKRRAGVKDSGQILPGHGGVMDRLDGLVPAAVAGAGAFLSTGWAG